jgi:Uma2 family endonuclease
MARAKVRFRADDIWDAPEDQYRYEVIDGDLYLTPAPAWRHQLSLMKLSVVVGAWIYGHDLGFVVQSPVGVKLDEENGVQPDLIYVSRGRADIISERGVEGPPDLVVEVLSPSTSARDRGIKMRRYAAAGVKHYWILDSLGPAIEVYELGLQGYDLIGVFGPGTIFRPVLFPGLEIEVDEIWT